MYFDEWLSLVTGDKEASWQVARASAAEKALKGSACNVGTIAAALRAVTDDVRPGDLPDADFLRTSAQGLLFQALAAILKEVVPIDV